MNQRFTRIVVAVGVGLALSVTAVVAQVYVHSGFVGDLIVNQGGTAWGTITNTGAIGSYLRSAGASAASAWSTLVLPNLATQGDLMVATSANTIGSVADVATGQVLTSGGASTVPVFSASPTLTTVTSATVNATTSVQLGGNLALSTAVPTITSGFGTSPSIVGKAAVFRLTLGNPVGQTGVVAFNTTYANVPSVQCGDEVSIAGDPIKELPTTTQVTLTLTLAVAGDTVACTVVGF